jgi:hypothetical protein
LRRLGSNLQYRRRALYQALQIGDVVCIYLHPGALAIPWYVLAQCG